MKIRTEQNYYKKQFLSGIFIAAAISTLLNIPVSIHKGFTAKAVSQVILVLVFFYAHHYLRKHKARIIRLSLVVFTFSFILGAAFTILADTKSLYWFLIFPPAILFTLTMKPGILWLAVSYVVLIPLLAFHTLKSSLPAAEAINFIFGYSFSFFSAYYIEKSRSSIEEELKKISITDFLTTAKNRRGFDFDLNLRIETATRYSRNFCLIILDLDYFKKINDNFGHSVGDQVLVEFVNIVKQELRPEDNIYRIGGEEFAIILSETELDGGKKFAERIREAVNSHQFRKIGKLTISMGLVEYQEGDKDETLKAADRLLYAAKNKGRDRIEA